MDIVRRYSPSLTASTPGVSGSGDWYDEMLLHGVQAHPLKDGDRVEIVPAISGG